MPGTACSFADLVDPVSWPEAERRRAAIVPQRLGRIVADVRLSADPSRLAPHFDRLREHGVSVLLGEHVDEYPARTPATSCRIAGSLGLDAIVTITGRGRTRDRARAEIAAMAGHEPVAIHCVTGDHPAARGFGPPADRPFATESFHLISDVVDVAASVPASAAESPASPPRHLRPRRTAEKQRAGASLAILNHAGAVHDLVAFADAVGAAGSTLPLVAPVPLVTDRTSAEVLARFPGLEPPPGFFDAVAGADDSREAGVALAADMAAALLDSGRFVAVNLSGSGSAGGMADRIAVICEVVDRLADRFGRLNPGRGSR